MSSFLEIVTAAAATTAINSHEYKIRNQTFWVQVRGLPLTSYRTSVKTRSLSCASVSPAENIPTSLGRSEDEMSHWVCHCLVQSLPHYKYHASINRPTGEDRRSACDCDPLPEGLLCPSVKEWVPAGQAYVTLKRFRKARTHCYGQDL